MDILNWETDETNYKNYLNEFTYKSKWFDESIINKELSEFLRLKFEQSIFSTYHIYFNNEIKFNIQTKKK